MTLGEVCKAGSGVSTISGTICDTRYCLLLPSKESSAFELFFLLEITIGIRYTTHRIHLTI